MYDSRSQSHTLLATVLVTIGLLAAAHPLAAQAVSVTTFISNVQSAVTSFTQSLPAANKPVMLGGQNIFAYGSAVSKATPQQLTDYTDGLKAAGVQLVEFNPGVTTINDSTSASNWDATVRHVRQLGMRLDINPEFLVGEFPVSSFQDFQTQAMVTYPKLAARYQPDIFVIVHEPTTMAARMGITTTPADWDAFIMAVGPLIHAASPHSKLGAGDCSGCNEDAYFQSFATLPTCTAANVTSGCLDYVSMDLYTDTELPTDVSWATTARANGKGVYMEETWAPKYLVSNPGNIQSNPAGAEAYTAIGSANAIFEPLDQQWLAAMLQFGSAYSFDHVTAFTTQCFFYYSTCTPGTTDTCPDKVNVDPQYTQSLDAAILAGSLTSTGTAYVSDQGKFGAKTATSINNASYATLPSVFNAKCNTSANTNPCNPDSTTAPDMLVSAFGADLANQTAVDSTYPTTLGGTTATLLDSSNTTIPVHLYSVSKNQVNYLMPSNAASGPATLTITSGDGTVTTGTVLVSPVAPGLYTSSATGQGTAAGIAVCAGTCSGWPNKLGNGQFWQYTFLSGCTSGNCAAPLSWGSGDSVVIELYGTGFRHRSADSAVSASINGQSLQVQFSGAQGTDTGLDQVNVAIPQSLSGAGDVNLVLTVQDTQNNITQTSNAVALQLH